jgi:hypothetical protein
MFGLEKSHMVESWNGLRMTIHGVMCDLPWHHLIDLLFLLFYKLWTIYFDVKNNGL